MADTIFAELMSPERLLYAGEIRSAILPSVDGDMMVLPGHAPVMAMLNPGIIFAIDAEGVGRRAFVRGGVADVSPIKLTIFAQRALPVEELTGEGIEEEVLYFQMRRDGSSDEIARAQMDVAISRLKEFKASLGLT